MFLTTKKLPARREHDHYPTDRETVERAFDGLRGYRWPAPDPFAPSVILDPGAGAGVWGQVARERYPDAFIEGVELRAAEKPAAYDHWHREDFLTARLWQESALGYDLVIGNPPYKHAEEFVRRGLARLTPAGGCLIFLLRLAFLESVKRREGLFKEHPLAVVHVLGKRPSFTGDGKSNATAFALFRWVKGYEGETRLGWI